MSYAFESYDASGLVTDVLIHMICCYKIIV